MIDFGTLVQRLNAVSAAITIADVSDPAQPLVFLNAGFSRMTGYGEEVLGTNCRFLQTEVDEAPERAEIRLAITEHRQTQVILSNQRADGEPFRNLLMLQPLKRFREFPRLFVGAQYKLGEEIEIPQDLPVNTLDREFSDSHRRALDIVAERRVVVAKMAARMAETWMAQQVVHRM